MSNYQDTDSIEEILRGFEEAMSDIDSVMEFAGCFKRMETA